MIFGWIYKAVCKITLLPYVGKTENFEKRKAIHIEEAMGGSNAHIRFYRALRKYKPNNFEWYIIQRCYSEKTLDKAEKKWIRKLKTLSPNGLNLTSGGDGNNYWLGKKQPKKMIEERTKKITGRKRTKEQRERIRNGRRSWLGKPLTKQQRMNIRLAAIGRISLMKGKHLSIKTKKLISRKITLYWKRKNR